MGKKIAFLISDSYQDVLDQCPEFLDEFKLLQPLFTEHGVSLVKANWRNPAVHWESYDLVIPKGCWDYTENPKEFAVFLEKMNALTVPSQNPVSVVKWNMRKTYLRDLKQRGFAVGELAIVDQGAANEKALTEEILLTAIKKEFGRLPEQLVVKPSISAGANDTVRIQPSEITAHLPLFESILKRADLILQPFFPEIADDGEYSYFFFGGVFSHAILKRPFKGDFRAHQLFGAQNLRYDASADEIAQALRFVNAASAPCAYARVDGFKRNGILHLIELELIEPYLYFEHAPPHSPKKFVQAVLNSMRNFA